MSTSNSNVELFETIKVTVIDNDKIVFKLHRLGFITCVCGEVIKNHSCIIINDVKEIKVKFKPCSEEALGFATRLYSGIMKDIWKKKVTIKHTVENAQKKFLKKTVFVMIVFVRNVILF